MGRGGVGGRWRTFEGITWSSGGNGVKISHCQQSIRRGLLETDCLGEGGVGGGGGIIRILQSLRGK